MWYFSSIEIQCNVGTNSLGYIGMLVQKIMQSTHKLGTKFKIIVYEETCVKKEKVSIQQLY